MTEKIYSKTLPYLSRPKLSKLYLVVIQRVAYHIGKLSNAEISDFSASRRVYRVEPRISSTFDKLGEGL